MPTARSVWMVCVVCVVCLAASSAHAGLYDALTEHSAKRPSDVVVPLKENPYATAAFQPVDKLTRGFINTVTGVLELPRMVGWGVRHHHWRYGLTHGVAQGVRRTGVRTAGGLWDLVTFPAPPYRTLYLRPEFVMGDATLYRGVPEQITWVAVEPAGSPLPHGPLVAALATLPQPAASGHGLVESP